MPGQGKGKWSGRERVGNEGQVMGNNCGKRMQSREWERGCGRGDKGKGRGSGLTDEGVAVAVQHGLVLTLGWLQHESVRHRPRDGRRVEAVVLQSLGHVYRLDL